MINSSTISMKRVEFRADTDFAMENLTGIYQAQWSLTSGESQGIADPQISGAGRSLRGAGFNSSQGVRHVNTITDIFRRLNKNMHGDDPNYYRLPDERELAAQYLLVVRDVAALRARSQQSNRCRQVIDPGYGNPGRHHNART